MKHLLFGLVLSFLVLPTLVAQGYVPEPSLVKALPNGIFAFIRTGAGTIVCKLEQEKAPLTVLNFVGLAEGTLLTSSRKGLPFYDGLFFHRVIKDFMIQGGDPEGMGSGGPGYNFADEFDPSLRFDKPGVLAMANSGPGTNGSQFFITHGPTTWLNDKHSIFGQVLVGQDIVDSISQGERIEAVRIVRKGKLAESYSANQAQFDALVIANEERAKAKYKDDLLSQEMLLQERFPQALLEASGLRSQVLKAPKEGTRPGPGQTLKVIMKGQLVNGKTVQFSPDNAAVQIKLDQGRLPAGFELALKSMALGEKRLFILPPQLAFGETGYPPVIPPWSYLILELELLAISS